MPCGKDGTG